MACTPQAVQNGVRGVAGVRIHSYVMTFEKSKKHKNDGVSQQDVFDKPKNEKWLNTINYYKYFQSIVSTALISYP